MVLPSQRISIERFEAFIAEPNNQDKNFELVRGEIVELPTNPYASQIAVLIAFFIQGYLREKKIEGHVTGGDGGYVVNDERYVPDVGYISKERQATLPYDEWFNPNPPELAVEVISPTDQDRMIRVKVANYLAAGTVVWVVYPPTKEIEVYRPGQSVDILSVEDTLDGGPVLPEFKLAVLEVFPASE